MVNIYKSKGIIMFATSPSLNNQVIDEQLIQHIQSIELFVGDQLKKDTHSWLKDWVSFCFQALNENMLSESFKIILNNKIQNCIGNHKTIDLYESSIFHVFFADLFYLCNQHFRWFEEVDINLSELEQEVDRQLNAYKSKPKNPEERKLHQKFNDLLDTWYESFVQQWFNTGINIERVESKELFYKNMFQVFLDARHLGLYSKREQGKVVEKYIHETIQSESMDVKQDNHLIIYRCFIDCLTKRNLSPELLSICQYDDFINFITQNPIEEEYQQEINTSFNAVVLRIISNRVGLNTFNPMFGMNFGHKNQSSQLKNVSIELSSNNRFTSENKKEMVDILCLGKIEMLNITNNHRKIFAYTLSNGIDDNQGILDASQVDRIRVSLHLSQCEKLVLENIESNFQYQFYSSDMYWRLRQLAIKAFDKVEGDEFSLDENQIKFSQFGEVGIKAYLYELNEKFVNQLKGNKIDKGYSLFCPAKDSKLGLAPEVIKGMNEFLLQQLERDREYVFCAQGINMAVSNVPHSINLLCELITLLDKAKLNLLTLNIGHLSDEEVAVLSKALQSINHTTVRFKGEMEIKQIISLEAINDRKLQHQVPFAHNGNKNNHAVKSDLANQPSVVTLAKIKALMDTEIHLKPIKGKIGLQNQHHFQQQLEQKTEVKILQSWQIEQAKETTQQSNHGHGIMFGDEGRSLISWPDIEAALNPKHPNHQVCYAKLGEEIVHYQFKGRNLVDLWQRLTGDVQLTRQNIIPKSKKEDPYSIGYFSKSIPKQISYKTLLTIVRHPHLFQDLNLHSLPSVFGFSAIEGALFTQSSDSYFNRSDEKSDPFAITINSIPKVNVPSAEHFFQLVQVEIPSCEFYRELLTHQLSVEAWHYWKLGFSALNIFNQKGISKLIELLNHEDVFDSLDKINYTVCAINYYYHLSKQQAYLGEEIRQIQFEYKQETDYLHGVKYSLSPALIQSISNQDRNNIHGNIIKIMHGGLINEYTDLQNDSNVQTACEKALLAVLSYHQNHLPEMIRSLPFVEADLLSKLLNIIGHQNSIKLLELAVCQDASVVFNIFTSLNAIYRVWGEIGIHDFSHCFLSPSPNYAPLADPAQQNAFTQLLQLTDVEYHWWQQLTLQHVSVSAFADFSALMAAYQYFLNELDQLGLQKALCMPCPLQGISNMQAGLNRVINILKKAKKPSEQMRNLNGLDWSICGVEYASQEVSYQFVNSDMQLNIPFESELQKLILKKHDFYEKFDHYHANPLGVNKFDLHHLRNEKDNADFFRMTLATFFRYIGSLKYTAPMIVYQQLIDAIHLPEKYLVVDEILGVSWLNGVLQTKPLPRPDAYPVVLGFILQVMAYALTGQRAIDRMPSKHEERVRVLNKFIHAVFEFSKERNSNLELNQLLVESNAVAYQKLVEVMDRCKDLYPGGRYHSENSENLIRLDLTELTQIVNFICLASDYYFTLKIQNEILFDKICGIIKSYSGDEKSSKDNAWCSNDVLGRSDNQFLFVKELLYRYNQYFLDTINRLIDFNPTSDFSCLIMACLTIKNHNFSFENQGRLIRMMGLIHFKLESLVVDAPQILEFLHKLSQYQDIAGNKALDDVLAKVSSCIPKSRSLIEVKQLIHFIDELIHEFKLKGVVDIKKLEMKYFKDFRPDHHLDEARDVDFYVDPAALELSHPGLGIFYDSIKSIVLKHYPVLFGDNKTESWQQFLYLIRQLENSEKQYQVLNTLIKSNKEIDLSTLNVWLSIMLKQSEYRIPFNPEFFISLNLPLLMHSKKSIFVKEFDSWLQYSSWFTTSDHSSYIFILNKIATIEGGELILEKFSRIASFLAWTNRRHKLSIVWQTHLNKIIDIWQNKSLALDSLNHILNGLIEFQNHIKLEDVHETQLDLVFLKWLSNIENTFELSLNFADQWGPQTFNKIVILSQVTDFDIKWLDSKLSELSIEHLEELASYYQLKPLPATPLLKRLLDGKLKLEDFIAEYKRDPHNERDSNKLNQQFDNEILWPYINRAKYLQPQQSKALPFAQELYAQLCFVNYVGFEKFRHLTVHELRHQLHECMKWLQEATDNQEKLVVYLTVLSLLREAIYKSTKPQIWLTAVQMLAAQSAINHVLRFDNGMHASPLFMQMATGEGKSWVALILAILTWLNGRPVAVVTHRASLALRDAKANGPLLESLGIECEALTADGYRQRAMWRQLSAAFSNDGKEKPEFTGIYYVECNDLILIRQQRLLNTGEDIDEMSFILDEADYTLLHNQTDNNLTQTTSAEDIHPYSWVFGELAAYLEKIKIQNNSYKVRVRDLVEYLRHTYPLASRVGQQVDFLIKLPIYLQAVWQARTLKNKTDFIPKLKNDKSDEYYASIILNDKPMPINVTYNGLIQQALHGMLTRMAKQRLLPHQFPILPETTLFSTMNPEAGIHWMNSRGSIIALSATLGSNSELMEMQDHFGFEYIKLPKMQSSLLCDYPSQFCANQQQQMIAISKICMNYMGERTSSKSRAILIVVDSIELAEQLNQHLNQLNPHMLHAGLDDISDQMLSELERQSGQSNHILIAVGGLIERGFDSKLSTAKQLVVISTYLKNGVDEVQVKGRAGRVNQTTGKRDKGKYYAVYDLEKECNRYPGLNIKTDDININPEGFKQKLYFAYYQQESSLRVQRQLPGVTKSMIQEHFFNLWKVIFKHPKILKEKRDKVMELYTEALEKIVNTIPVDYFLDDDRHQYNDVLIKIYEDALHHMKVVIGELAQEIMEMSIADLLEKIELQQRNVINNYKKALAMGVDEPELKIHKKWKPGVKYNSYLDSGKQGNFNYWKEAFNGWWLSDENKMMIEHGRKSLEKKIAEHHLKKSDFLSELKQMIVNALNHEELLQRYIFVYHQKTDYAENAHDLSLYIPQVTELTHVISITKKMGSHQSISLIHDPGNGQSYRVSLISNRMGLFDSMQKCINQLYEFYKIKENLNFRISVLGNDHPGLYQLMIDFSGHAFDYMNRNELFTKIGQYFEMDAKQLFQSESIPPVSVMRHILRDLQSQMFKYEDSVPNMLMPIFHFMEEAYTRNEYFEKMFMLAILILENNYSKLSSFSRITTDALMHFSNPLPYKTLTGEQRYTCPPTFTNLDELINNELKRKVLAIINTGLFRINKNPMCHDILCKQQVEYLIQLGLLIAYSTTSESLHVIYDKWQKTPISYSLTHQTMIDFMKLKKEEPAFFGKNSSPDMFAICQKIDDLIAGEPNFKETLSIGNQLKYH